MAADRGGDAVAGTVVDRFGCRDQVTELGCGKRAGEVDEPVWVHGWFVVAVPGEGDDPAFIFLGERDPAARQGGGGADADAEVAVDLGGFAPVAAGGVGEVDGQSLFLRPRIAEGFEPALALGAAAGCVHDQVGVEDVVCDSVRRATVRGAAQGESGDGMASGVGDDADGGAVVEDFHVGQGVHQCAEVPFDQRAAGDEETDSGNACGPSVTVEDPPEVRLAVTGWGAEADEVVGEAGEQFLDCCEASCGQRVSVPGVGHAAPRGRDAR